MNNLNNLNRDWNPLTNEPLYIISEPDINGNHVARYAPRAEYEKYQQMRALTQSVWAEPNKVLLLLEE